MKNIFRDESGVASAFTWAVLIVAFLFIMIVWTALWPAIQSMIDIGVETNNALAEDAKDPMIDYMILIIELFPLWLMMGLSIFGLSKSQKQEGY